MSVNEIHMSQRGTKDNENNPPFPPLEKGGRGDLKGIFRLKKIRRELHAK